MLDRDRTVGKRHSADDFFPMRGLVTSIRESRKTTVITGFTVVSKFILSFEKSSVS